MIVPHTPHTHVPSTHAQGSEWVYVGSAMFVQHARAPRHSLYLSHTRTCKHHPHKYTTRIQHTNTSHTCNQTSTHPQICTYAHIHARARAHTLSLSHTHTYTRTHPCTHTHTHTHNTHVHTSTKTQKAMVSQVLSLRTAMLTQDQTAIATILEDVAASARKVLVCV